MSKTFLRLGYPKTGGTTLNRHLFGTSKNLLYLGKPFIEKDVERWTMDMCYNSSLDFSPDAFRAWFQDYRSQNDDFPIFLSHEGFLTTPTVDLQIICERIHKVFGSCHIILTLRNQWEIISSFYHSAGFEGRYLFINGLPSLPSFPMGLNEWVDQNMVLMTPPDIFHHKSFFSYLDFDKVITYLKSAFGKENVSILFFENFLADKSSYVKQFEDILGCKFDVENFDGKHENKTFYEGMNWKAYLDRIYHKYLGEGFIFKQNQSPIELFKSNLRKELRLKLENYFCAANKRLQENIDTDLKSLGYPM